MEQNGHFSWALMDAVGPWMGWVGPREAMILCTAPCITLNKCQVLSAQKHENLFLEQNSHFSWALEMAVGPWMGWVGAIEDIILCTAPSITL